MQQGKEDTVVVRIDQSAAPKVGEELGSVYLAEGNQEVLGINTDQNGDAKAMYTDALMLILDHKRSPTAEVDATIVSEAKTVDRPSTIALDQNYPNPFNPTTTIPFELSQPMAINLELYDVLGRKIQTLIQNEFYGVGAHVIHFDVRALGGLYYYRF